MRAGWHALIVAINLADNQSILLLKDLFMSRNTALTTVAVLAASLEAVRGNTTEGRGFWEIYFLELLIVGFWITE
jgi:hypothetical protein